MSKQFILPLFVLAILGIGLWSGVPSPVHPGGAPMGVNDPDDKEGLLQWTFDRLHDPTTGEVPADIRRKELTFAATIPPRATAKSLTWTWRGPRNRGGRTRAVVVDRTDAQTVLAGSATGGLWRSTDGGQSWMRTSPHDAMTGVSSIAQDPRPGSEQTWYFGTGENYGVVSGTSFSALLPGDGMFKSTDGGQSWTHLTSTIAGDHENYNRSGSFKQVNSIVVDPVRNDSDVVLAAVYNGIFRSNDGGQNWHPTLGLQTGGPLSLYTEVRVTSSGVYYAAIGNNGPFEGFWRSTDGLHWTPLTPAGLPGDLERTVIAIDPGDENVVYWFSETPSTGTHGHHFWKYTYLSGDGTNAGGDWQDRTANLPNGTCTGYFNFDFGYINSQTSYDMCLAVDPMDPGIVYLGGTSLYRSTDAFATADSIRWIGGYRCNTNDPKDYVYPGHHPDQHWVTFPPNDPLRMFSGSDGGVALTLDRLADSVQWQQMNTTYVTSQFYTVHLEEGGASNAMVLGGLQDNGCWLSLTDNINDDWKYVHQDDGAYCAIPQGHPFILTSSQSGRLYKKTVDAQGNVTGYERIDPIGGTNSYNFINPFVLDPVDNNVCYWLSASRIWRNTDLSAIPVTDNFYDRVSTNWEQIGQATVPTSQRITALDIGYSAPNTLFYGTINSHLYRLDSLDATPVRTEISSTDWPADSYVSCVAPNDLDPQEWLLTFSNYGVMSVWHTVDGGTTWESVSGNLEENADGSGSGPAVFWAAIYGTWAHMDDRYFVATSTGLYSTALLDGDNTVWEQEGSGSIGNVPVNMIAVRNSDGLVAVGTHGNGVYSAHLAPAPIGVPENVDLQQLHLWPNPAHAQVTVEMPDRGTHEVVILDIQGRVILQRKLATMTTWTWDLRDAAGMRVATGAYLLDIDPGSPAVRHARVVVE
ncbi:MAG: hypothetical protein H6595_08575 [Flavobacteriales bacterium]|nr:hypothetical protein [Flavobacteriales bacterium]MCB9167521.1 hypothetical protein [Flavobacteriales bacterium]